MKEPETLADQEAALNTRAIRYHEYIARTNGLINALKTAPAHQKNDLFTQIFVRVLTAENVGANLLEDIKTLAKDKAAAKVKAEEDAKLAAIERIKNAEKLKVLIEEEQKLESEPLDSKRAKYSKVLGSLKEWS